MTVPITILKDHYKWVTLTKIVMFLTKKLNVIYDIFSTGIKTYLRFPQVEQGKII